MKFFYKLLILITILSIMSCTKLEYFKIIFPDDSGKARINFTDKTWLQIIPGATWKTSRFDLNLLIDSKESYTKVMTELPNIAQYLNCNLVGNVQLRCIIWGDEIALLVTREENVDNIIYLLEIKSSQGGVNANIEMKITENVSQTRDIIDSIIAKKDPEYTLAFLQ